MKLYYFNLKGRAESIRATLSIAKVPFEDVRLSHEEFTKLKEAGKFEFGQMPALELEDGRILCQSLAIITWCGKKYGLFPQDADLAYIVDSNLECQKDFMEKVYKNFFSKDEEEKKKLTNEILTVDFPKFC